jgi:hypothetical protein
MKIDIELRVDLEDYPQISYIRTYVPRTREFCMPGKRDLEHEPDETEDEMSSIGPSRRTQLGELRDETAKLEKTVNDVNARIRALADGPIRAESETKGRALAPLANAPITNLATRIRNVRTRLETGALERLRRIGTE